MCRNIKILRAPYAVGVTDDDVHAAALQYVRTVGGVRIPSPHNEQAFNRAVDAISAVTWDLLAGLEASQEQLEATPEHPAASPERLEASPEPLTASPEPLTASPEPLTATPEQPGGLVPYGRPMVLACEISMESGGLRSTPSGSLR
jgi:hypothetical protein